MGMGRVPALEYCILYLIIALTLLCCGATEVSASSWDSCGFMCASASNLSSSALMELPQTLSEDDCLVIGDSFSLGDSHRDCSFSRGGLILISSVITCEFPCALDLELEDGNIHLLNSSSLRVSSLVLKANNLFIDESSSILGDAMAPIPEKYSAFPIETGIYGGGGGHAGYGSPPCGKLPGSIEAKGGQNVGALVSSFTYGGAGSCIFTHTESFPTVHGGGRITLRFSNSIELNGTLSVNGGSSPPNGNKALICGGGAGGSISIFCGRINPGLKASISAIGGSGYTSNPSKLKGGGGSGGRIYISSRDEIPSLNLNYNGGATSSEDNSPCDFSNGASGLFYSESNAPLSGLEKTISCVFLNSKQSQGDRNALTPILTDQLSGHLSSIILSHCNASVVNQVDDRALIVTDTFQSTASELSSPNQLLQIVASTISFTSGSSLKLNEMLIESSDSVSFDMSTDIFFTSMFQVFGGKIRFEGIIADNDASTAVSYVRMIGSSIEIAGFASIKAFKIFLNSSSTLEVNGSIKSKNRPSVNCSHTIPLVDSCGSTGDIVNRYYSTALFGSAITLGSKGSISSSNVIFCSDTSDLLGRVAVSGYGCFPGAGKGAGTATGSGPGSGAGHGNIGGSSGSARGGIAYDAFDGSSIPKCRGSGGGGLSGGAGGGIIHIFSSHYINLDGGILESDGQDGGDSNAGGGGGGSGGSILLQSHTLKGKDASISVRGGKGGSPGGGGGAGGILYLDWIEHTSSTEMRHSPGQISVSGGHGDADGGGRNGLDGITIAHPPCQAGQYGLFCHPCEPGSYKPREAKVDSCIPCLAGKFSSRNGSSSCTSCSAGTFSAMNSSTGCQYCEAGSFSLGSAVNCMLCPAGRYSEDLASTCLSCWSGSYTVETGSSSCMSCPIGKYSDEHATSCLNCTKSPLNGIYLESPDCSYKCLPGFVYPKCNTPWESLIISFHGPLIFSVALIVGMVVLAFPFFFCWFTEQRKKERKYLSDLRAAGRLKSKFISAHNENDHQGYRALETEIDEDSSEDESEFMATYQLNDHYHRIYLCGCNSVRSHFVLSDKVDEPLLPLIYSDSFAELADDLSCLGKWSFYERSILWILYWFHMPSYLIVLDSFRYHKVQAIRNRMHMYDYQCLRNPRARAMANSWVYGYSPCMSLSWIDVFCFQGENTTPFRKGKPILPMSIICSGDGTFASPFQFNMSDPLVKCLSAYFGSKWFIFLSNLNNLTRAMNPGKFGFHNAMLKAYQYVELMKIVGIGIGRQLPIGGIEVSLAYAAPKTKDDIGRPCLILEQMKQADQLHEDAINLAQLEVARKLQSESSSFSISFRSKFGSSNSLESGLDGSDVGFDEIVPMDLILNNPPQWIKKPSCLHFFSNLIFAFFLQRSKRDSTRSVKFYQVFFLLFIEIWLNLAIITTFSQLKPVFLWSFIFIPPLASICSPLVGFACIVMSSAEVGRIFLTFNLISTLNSIVALICGLASLYERTLNIWMGLFFPLALLLLKVILARFALKYIAHLEHERDILLTRVDILKDDKNSPRSSSAFREFLD